MSHARVSKGSHRRTSFKLTALGKRSIVNALVTMAFWAKYTSYRTAPGQSRAADLSVQVALGSS